MGGRQGEEQRGREDWEGAMGKGEEEGNEEGETGRGQQGGGYREGSGRPGGG